ncbi:YtxH domain-containing protein [Hymenobacter elongatus]|uniref:YtxH domain-containing protein n=1 Tax=Hymenobacter elongatus TaxID=877208 RepID=A0A4Z0PPD3_9BACT|nr:YtxH domain-containing protein [Hymenobacter elongatus]TGE16569.1 YtxH domain-containing protein [Hymenobacter elongatus]
MKDNSGKVILSLLVGATAGVVAGLLLAPETGTETRTGLKKSASKWSDDLGKLLKDSLAHLNTPAAGEVAPAPHQDGRNAADELLKSMSQDTSASSHATSNKSVASFEEGDSDYDGSGSDARHSGSGYGKSL